MTIYPAPICLWCIRYVDPQQIGARPTCAAFPDGIPDKILEGGFDHRYGVTPTVPWRRSVEGVPYEGTWHVSDYLRSYADLTITNNHTEAGFFVRIEVTLYEKDSVDGNVNIERWNQSSPAGHYVAPEGTLRLWPDDPGEGHVTPECHYTVASNTPNTPYFVATVKVRGSYSASGSDPTVLYESSHTYHAVEEGGGGA